MDLKAVDDLIEMYQNKEQQSTTKAIANQGCSERITEPFFER